MLTRSHNLLSLDWEVLFMVRENKKEQSINYSNTIKKSNELSIAELNYGLSLNQMQLLAFAIYCTQQNGKTEFKKYEFQEKFQIQQYRTEDAYIDSAKIMDLKASVKDLEQDYFKFTNIFIEMVYHKGHFKFEWNPKMIPHILELKERYIITDLKITSHFKSGFSWRLYDYLKAHYGYWHKELSKDELMRLFAVEDVKSYQKGTAHFKRRVLDVAISEINEYTELEVWYTEKKIGNKITDFILHWSTGKQVAAATEKQLTLLREIHDEVERNMIDYLSLKNVNLLDLARQQILAVKEIHKNVKKGLSSKDASRDIQKAKDCYLDLEHLLKQDGQVRDTSFYYNWLEEDD